MKLKASYVAFMTMFLVLILDQSSLVAAKKKKPNQGGMGGMGGMGGGGMNSRKSILVYFNNLFSVWKPKDLDDICNNQGRVCSEIHGSNEQDGKGLLENNADRWSWGRNRWHRGQLNDCNRK